MMKLTIGCIGILIIVALSWPARMQAAPALPPRPTVVPTAGPSPVEPRDPAEGGWIALCARAGAATIGQDLWTVVQWQDQAGNWNVVEGWQGNFDQVVGADGFKTWWVAPRDRAKGPFRWVVYQGPGGALLSMSEPFYLPRAESETVRVELWLAH